MITVEFTLHASGASRVRLGANVLVGQAKFVRLRQREDGRMTNMMARIARPE